MKGKFKGKVIFGICLVFVLALAFIFIRDYVKSRDDFSIYSMDEFIDRLGDCIDDEEREILINIDSHPYKPGVYVYNFVQKDFSTDNYKFVSDDDRSLSFPGKDMFDISDGKYIYFASQTRKNYIKREISSEEIEEEKKYQNQKFDYLIFFDYDGTLIDGFDVRKEGDKYIVENKDRKRIFDKDYVLIDSFGLSGGEKFEEKLISYTDDFDRYYDKYFSMLKDYKEVDDVNLVSPKN